MKKKQIIFLFIFCLINTGFFVKAETTVRFSAAKPPLQAPKFTDAERQAELARRRANVLNQMATDSILILFSADTRIYANDVDFLYRQENNLYYLTNLEQNGATLVLLKNGPDKREILFLPKRIPQSEVWNGRRYSREEGQTISGIQTIIDAGELDEFIKSLRAKAPFVSKDQSISVANSAETVYLLSDGRNRRDREFENEGEFARSLGNFKIVNARPIFAGLRLVKSPLEIKLLQHAIDITAEGAKRAMKTVGEADWEYEVQAEIEYEFRRNNADYWGFPSIVAAGENATTLHYEESQAPVKKGDLLLTDIGAEYEHYSADITRTFPVSGNFSKEQAEIYQIVYDAQNAVAAAAKPGTNLIALNQVAVKSVKENLTKLGLITAPDATYKVNGYEREQYSLWYLHFFGHWLGMNVHDVGSIGTSLRPGMVFTNEPGIYIRADALDQIPDTPENREVLAKIKPTFEKYKNIGVRIEDDLLVTQNGVDWLTKKLPRSIAEIEAFMAVK